jgi:hypothetical protein
LAGTPSANQAPPVASVTDQRAPCGLVSRSVAEAAGTVASIVHRAGPQVTVIGPAASTVFNPAPPAGTGTSSPSTTTTRSRSAAGRQPSTTSIWTVAPVTTGRGGPERTLSSPSATIDTSAIPAGTSSPTAARTAPAQSPEAANSSKAGPRREKRAHRNMSGNASSPQPTPCSACIRR